MLALSLTAYVNDWYNGGSPANVKPLLYGGVATVVLEMLAVVSPRVATAIGYSALLGYLLAGGAGAGTPIANLQKIGKG